MEEKILFHSEKYLNGGRQDFYVSEKYLLDPTETEWDITTVYVPPANAIHQSLDATAKARNETSGKWKEDGVVYASFHPSMFRIIQDKYQLEDNWETTPEGMEFLLKLLDSDEYKKFRVYEGRIGNAATFKEY